MSRKRVLITATMAVTIVAAVYATFWLLGQRDPEPSIATETTPDQTQAATPDASEDAAPERARTRASSRPLPKVLQSSSMFQPAQAGA